MGDGEARDFSPFSFVEDGTLAVPQDRALQDAPGTGEPGQFNVGNDCEVPYG